MGRASQPWATSLNPDKLLTKALFLVLLRESEWLTFSGPWTATLLPVEGREGRALSRNLL